MKENDFLETLDKEKKLLKEKIRQKTAVYILGGLGFVAGLAWNEAIKGLIDFLFPLKKDTLIAKFIYAIIITLILVIVSVYILKTPSKEDKNR